MSNTYAIVRYVTATIICAAIILCGAYNSIFKQSVAVSYTDNNITDKSTVSSQFDVSKIESNILNNSSDEPLAQSNLQAESAVATAASGTVQGKVVERFISPYTANTSYNNVYLKNNTELDINLKSFLNGKLGYKIKKNNEPQVLILHTHATESYLRENRDYYTDADLSRTTDNNYNMVALGKIVADRLNEVGIKTLHDTTAHDYPSYSESYSRAAETICNYTEKYPSIKVVIDLHRDAIAANDTDKVKVTTEIDGKKAAQIMLVMGSQSGSVTNFPEWKENLKLATKIQQTIEVMYPTLARSIHFMSKNYNQSLTTGSLLIEIGTDGNTIDEAKYSAELLSNALINLFNSLG